jgi:hypothetical protein
MAFAIHRHSVQSLYRNESSDYRTEFPKARVPEKTLCPVMSCWWVVLPEMVKDVEYKCSLNKIVGRSKLRAEL